MKKKRKSLIKKVITEHIKNNLREYAIVTMLFIIGVLIGIIFINNVNQTTQEEIKAYMNSIIDIYKSNNLDNLQIFRKVLMQNIILAILLWFIGSTVIGAFLVYGVVLYKGVCLGYTISAAIATLGNVNGLIFSLAGLFLQNIFLIPAILAIAVSGMKLYRSIMKDKRRENIKVEIIRHTIFSLIMLVLLTISAMIEAYASTYLLLNFVKYI